MQKWNKRVNRAKQHTAVLLLNIGIVIAVIWLAAASAMLRGNMQETQYSLFKGDRAQYYMEQGEYGTLVSYYYQENIPVTGTAGLDEEAIALAEYTEAAMMYRAYAAEDPEAYKARHEKLLMNEAREKVGLYEGEIDRIEKALDAAVK